MIANPILYKSEVLTSWSSGDGLIATKFNNDFGTRFFR